MKRKVYAGLGVTVTYTLTSGKSSPRSRPAACTTECVGGGT